MQVQAHRQAHQGEAGQQNYQNNNDDVVDGDYTEV